MGWMMQTKSPVIIHTDGSCLKNPDGVGGWAAVVIRDGMEIELTGSVAVSTNNRMELLAVIQALKFLDGGSNVYLFTDSQYVQKGIQFWVPAWKRRGWVNAQKKPVVNRDLWELLDAENGRHMVSWHWVRGHDGDKYNERCDVLARQAADRCNQLLKEGSPQ